MYPCVSLRIAQLVVFSRTASYRSLGVLFYGSPGEQHGLCIRARGLRMVLHTARGNECTELLPGIYHSKLLLSLLFLFSPFRTAKHA